MNALLPAVLKLSVVSSYTILFVLVIRFLLRKSPKLFSYALWGIVFLKLIIPVSFESNFSFIPRQINTVSIESSVLRNTFYRPEVQVTENLNNNPIDKSDPQKPHTGRPPFSPYSLFPYVWATGFSLFILTNFIQFRKLQKKLTGAAHVENNLFQSELIQTPFVMGIIKPKIYIPAGLSDYEQTYIVRHEQVHILHKDYLIKFIAYFITCIYWFNPLVLLSFILMTRDMEMACDETVIKELGETIKKEYSASLLSLAAGQSMPGGMPLAFGENAVKSRIKNVLNYKKPGIWAVMISTLLIVFVCTGLFFNPAKAAPDSFKNRKQPVASNTDNTLESSTSFTFKADLTHDGNMETIIVDTSRVAEKQTAVISVVNEYSETLWSNEAATAHAGWNSLYLTTINGMDYILRYQPSMFQGNAAYEYDLFYLNNTGSKLSYDSDRMEFSINPGKIDYEPENLASFAGKINEFFKNSYLLLSTENGDVKYSTPQNKITGAENYSWLDDGGITYESQELLDKLIKFKEKYSE